MKIDIDKLTEAELVDLNNRIVVSEGEESGSAKIIRLKPE